MKKKGFILAAIFIVFLCIGVWFNMQRGLYLQDTFWKLGPDGAYVSPRGDTIRYSETDGYHLNFNGNMLTVQVENHADGSYRFDFSDGIAMETADESSMLLQIGGGVLAGEMDYIVTDVNSDHFRFVRASETIHEPFYDESGERSAKASALWQTPVRSSILAKYGMGIRNTAIPRVKPSSSAMVRGLAMRISTPSCFRIRPENICSTPTV